MTTTITLATRRRFTPALAEPPTPPLAAAPPQPLAEAQAEVILIPDRLPAIADPADLIAACMIALDGGDIGDRAEAMRALAARTNALTRADSGEIQRSLALHAPLLELMAVHFLHKACKDAAPHVQQTFLSMGLAAQKNLMRLLAALHTVKQDAKVIAST